ncbi:MAG TPA: LamG domain-containing protein, partial [Phytomonospora sp.]
MSVTARRLVSLLIPFIVAARLFSQIAPPPQTHVADLRPAPLRGTLPADFTAGGRFTLEGWIYLTGNTPFAWIMGKGLPTSGADPFLAFALQLNDDGTRLAFNASTGAAGTYRGLTSPAPLPLRTWTHVAATVDGTTTRLFINGQQVAAGTLAGPVANPADVPFGLGIAYLANGNTNYPAFPGYARQTRVWTTARTAAQLATDAAVATPSDRTGLYAAWPLDEASGTGARDTSGNNRPLTGGGATLRTAILDAGAFYAVTVTTPAGNVLADADDGILIDFDNDGDLDLLTFHITVPPTIPETRRRLRAQRHVVRLHLRRARRRQRRQPPRPHPRRRSRRVRQRTSPQRRHRPFLSQPRLHAPAEALRPPRRHRRHRRGRPQRRRRPGSPSLHHRRHHSAPRRPHHRRLRP